VSDFLYTPVFKWPLLVLLALIVAGAIGWSLWTNLRSPRQAAMLGGFRLLALLALVLMLIQPQKRYDEVTILKPQIAVLVDDSESMTDAVDESQPRRADRAREILASPVLEKARKDFDVRMFSFDAKLAELGADAKDIKFQGGISNLAGAVNQVQERFRGQPLAGVLLLSDGLDTTGIGKMATLSGGAPVFTFELEKEFKAKEKGKRISIGSVDYPARVVVGWDQEIRAGIVGSGMSGQTVGIELWRDGRKEKEATVAFNEDEQTRPVVFPLAPVKPGMMQYEIRVTDAAADKEAKSYPFVVEALAPGKRILYLQNSLGFDFKFLRRAVVSDRNLQLSAFVRWADGRIVSMGERGVAAEAKLDFTQTGLSKYSVVILGDLAAEALTADNYAALKEFVNRGGGLVLLGGPNQLASADLAKTPLGELSPVKLPAEYRETPTVVKITDAGLRHPVFGPLFASIKDFPPLLTVNMGAGLGPTAEVLIEGAAAGKTVPIVAAQRFGQGRVVSVMTDTVWRWRLAAKSWSAEKSPYDTFWTQLMDWLIPKEQDKTGTNKIELFTERANYLLGERPEVRAIVRLVDDKAKLPAALSLDVKTPDEKVFKYTLKAAKIPGAGGQQIDGYRAEVEPNVPGVFAATSSADVGGVKIEGETRFVVAKPITELTGKAIDRDFLKHIAESTGGKFFPLDDAGAWLANIHYNQQQFSRMQLSDLWNHPVLIVLLVAALAGDWLARKLWNLP
jgi:uncharacterized membrane protein